MPSKYIYVTHKATWSSDEEVTLINSWVRPINYDELQKIFPQYTKQQIKRKAVSLKLYTNTSPVHWSDDEVTMLVNACKPYGNYDELQKLFPNRSIIAIRRKMEALGLKSNLATAWTESQVAILIEVWPSCTDVKNITHLFDGKTERAICDKAKNLNLQKTNDALTKIKEAKRLRRKTRNDKDHLIKRQEITNIAMTMNSRQEFIKKFNKYYCYARNHGFLDEICEHMIVGDSFSYPQAFLFGCIKELFPEETILYNDRKTIHPRELDVYIPNLKIAFEYDGFNFHKNDDGAKDRLCESLGIKLYHIKEGCKAKPEPVIINALESFGYDCSRLNVQHLVEVAFSKKITKDHIIKCVSSVSTMKEFRRTYSNLYAWLYRRNLLDQYCSHLEQSPKEIQRNDVLDFIKTKIRKSEVIGTKYYRALSKKFRDDVELINAYNQLQGRFKMKML